MRRTSCNFHKYLNTQTEQIILSLLIIFIMSLARNIKIELEIHVVSENCLID